MRTPIATLLVLALAAAPLAGCAKSVPMGVSVQRAGAKVRAKSAVELSGPALANRFAELMGPYFNGTLAVKGAVVSLSADDLTTTYDFTDTPETHTVAITAEEFTTRVPLDELMQGAPLKPGGVTAEVLPVLLVPIATQVAIAAAKALAMYYITHRGGEFDKSDAAKACVVAMGLSLIPFIGPLGTVGQFVPVAAKILGASSSFAYKDLAVAAMGLLDEIVPIVLTLIKARKAS